MTILQFAKKIQDDIKEMHRLLSALPTSVDGAEDLRSNLAIARIDFNIFRGKLQLFIEKNKEVKT